MFEAVLFGTITGAVAGLVPGVGIMISLMIVYPLIEPMSLTNLILFYISLASTTQYMGSVSAIYFAIPGEMSSVPAVKEGYKMSRKGLGQLAISSTAIGSIIGAAMAVLLTFLFAEFLLDVLKLTFRNNVKMVLYTIIIGVLLFAFNKNNRKMNLLLLALGFMFTLPGTAPDGFTTRLSFGIKDLEYGIPFFPAVVGALVLPTLLNNQQPKPMITKIIELPLIKHILIIPKYLKTIFRSSFIGYFCGFVPGLTTILATNTAYNIEKTVCNRTLNRIVAAETSNNSAQFTSFIPLLLLGIPITGSEAIIYNMALNKNFTSEFWLEGGRVYDLLTLIGPYFLLTNLLAFGLAWPLSKYVAKLATVPSRYINITVLIVCFIVSGYVGSQDLRTLSYLTYTLFFCIIGYMFRKYDTLPFVFMFLLGREIEYQSYIFYQLNIQ
jgi:putative tricarboxylic transport membrane protein